MRKKSTSILSIGLMAAAIAIPSGRAFAADPPGNREQRQELREEIQELQRLRRARDRELSQGDYQDAREYNEKIRDQRREIRQDRRDIHRSDRERDWYRDWRWGRD
ncbi:MAG: hypothetical protein ACXWYD_15750 [Candidatus Binatia bacterium]